MWSDWTIWRRYSFSLCNMVICFLLFLQFGILFFFFLHPNFFCLLIIISDDIDSILVLKTKLARKIKIKDFSSLWYFLGIEVAYSPKRYFLSQSKYFTDIPKRARLTDNKIVDTLIEVKAKYYSSNDLLLSNPILYRTIVGSLVYLIITLSDIAYVVHVVSWFVVSPIIVHWVIVLTILQYLQDTVFQSLLLSFTFSLKLCVYYDADHGSDLIDHKFVTGFCIFY